MLTITIIRHGRSCARPQWWCGLPGAQGSGWSPFEALAEALAVWARRGAPMSVPELEPGRPDYGADWVIDRVIDRGPGEYYRFHIEGTNLNTPVGAYGRIISWNVRDLDDRRYELLPGAFVATERAA